MSTESDTARRVFLAEHRRRKARRMIARGYYAHGARQLALAEQMFASAGERFLDGAR